MVHCNEVLLDIDGIKSKECVKKEYMSEAVSPNRRGRPLGR